MNNPELLLCGLEGKEIRSCRLSSIYELLCLNIRPPRHRVLYAVPVTRKSTVPLLTAFFISDLLLNRICYSCDSDLHPRLPDRVEPVDSIILICPCKNYAL